MGQSFFKAAGAPHTIPVLGWHLRGRGLHLQAESSSG